MSSSAPNIIVSSRDVQRIEELLASPQHRHAAYAETLLAEMARADIVEPEQVPADVVSMNSVVKVQDEVSGEISELTLVYPRDASTTAGNVSVLAPVGSALLGLRVGQSIQWPTPAGSRRLAIRDIAYQPEAAGHYHR